MLVKSITEEEIYGIGHAFGYYDYGQETGMSAAFSGKEATANYICAYVRGVLRGGFLHTTSERSGAFLQDRMDKEKKPYIIVGLVCVREKYQGQGYMRKVLNFAFAEGDRLGVPVILETDAKSKCDKYVHLGMELAGTHDLGAFGKLYDLIRYPESSNENGTT